MGEESNRMRTLSESSNQGTLRTRGRYKMERLDSIINKGEEKSKSERKSLEKLLEDCKLKIKNNVPAADFQEIADGLEKYMQEHDEKDRNLFQSLKKLHDSLNKIVTDLSTRVTDLENEVQVLTADLDEVKQKLELSEKLRARIQLRHFLKRIESMIFKKFRPEINLSKDSYTVSDLKRIFGSDQTKLESLSNFLEEVGFKSDFNHRIWLVIQNCNLNSYAHPEPEVVSSINDEEDLDKLLEEAQILHHHRDEIKDFAPCYFKLVEELHNSN